MGSSTRSDTEQRQRRQQGNNTNNNNNNNLRMDHNGMLGGAGEHHQSPEQQQQQQHLQQQQLMQQQQAAMQHHHQQQQGASNFGRRVTIGGGNPHDFRRGSFAGLASAAGMIMMDEQQQQPPNNSNNYYSTGGVAGAEELRRGSIDMLGGGMDNLLGYGSGARRGSMDSTTAALDAAILDLTRRRYSMATGGMGGVGDSAAAGGAAPSNLQAMTSMGMNLQQHQPGGGGGMLGAGPPQQLQSSISSMGGGYGSAAFGQSQHNPNQQQPGGYHGYPSDSYGSAATTGASAAPATAGGGPQAANSLAARQQQLQAQQRVLEQRQRELEQQRQQLIASMQDRNSSYGMMAAMHQPSAAMLASKQSQPPSYAGLLPQQPRGSMGLAGSSSAFGGGGAGVVSSSGAGNQWYVCHICNSKAFASQEEAMAHETLCAQQHQMHAAHAPPAGTSMSRSRLLAQLNNQDAMMAAAYNQPSLHDSYPSLQTQQLHHHHHLHQSQQGMDDSARSNNYSPNNNSGHPSASMMQQVSSPPAAVATTLLSTGPFADLEKPTPLAMPSDKDWLTPLHCFVRRNCVQVFTATQDDVATPSKGKRKPITPGQVGIRCPHCHNSGNKARERGSVYYPTSISSIYNATMNLLQRHLHSCASVPDEIMRRYETLKADDARSGTSKKYWIESARSLGLVDTAMGIRVSADTPPPLPSLTSSQETEGHAIVRRNSNDFFSSSSNAAMTLRDDDGEEGYQQQQQLDHGNDNEMSPGTRNAGMDFDDMHMMDPAMSSNTATGPLSNTGPLVAPEDKPYATAFSFELLGQMQPCVFTEADRLGKRKGLPPSFPGLACRHCFGGYGSGRFFPSSIKTLSDTSKTLNVLHNHMMRCRKCPAEVREVLESLRGTHDEERAKMKFGSQKAFFGRIWERLHGENPIAHQISTPPKRKATVSFNPSAATAAMALQIGLQQEQQKQQQQQRQELMHQHVGPPPLDMTPLTTTSPHRQTITMEDENLDDEEDTESHGNAGGGQLIIKSSKRQKSH